MNCQGKNSVSMTIILLFECLKYCPGSDIVVDLGKGLDAWGPEPHFIYGPN